MDTYSVRASRGEKDNHVAEVQLLRKEEKGVNKIDCRIRANAN